jgi:glycosyltransferase involved in cell wall biosynthesis
MPRSRVLLVHHFFHPDDVVSARLFTDLALGLSARGWDVTALTSDRSWSNPQLRHPPNDRLDGVLVERVHRPPWDQSKPSTRLANSAWMLAAWTQRMTRMPPADVVLVGSDPAFAPVALIAWRRLWPHAAMVHWCYDVYPEAIVADGAGAVVRAMAPLARRLMGNGYRRCDALVDLGPGMRRRLEMYDTAAMRATIPPWALVEPSDAPRPPNEAVRRELFGEARLAILYSGTLGRAHDFRTLLDLARACRRRAGGGIAFCFSGRGHRMPELAASLRPDDTNVRIAPFCSEDALAARLEAADIHALSLQPAWGGLVVPSKFFGSLAVGRPVLYAGPRGSDIGDWITSLNVGYAVSPATIDSTADALNHLAESPETLSALQRRARQAYDAEFCRTLGITRWDGILRSLIAGGRGG